MVSIRPPWRSVRMFDWKPTDVKNASMNMSLSVPSNDTSIWNMVYSSSVATEKSRPPDTGDGMQNFLSHFMLCVMNIPVIRASTPTPADCIISSVTVSYMFVELYVKNSDLC